MRDRSPGVIILIILGIAVLIGLYAMKGVERHNRQQQRTLQSMQQQQWQQERQEEERARKDAEERLAGYVALLEQEHEQAEQNRSDSRMYEGHAYVDLGLSVKWALCNVGAARPEERGVPFSWGDPAPHSVFDWTTYKWSLSRKERTRGSLAKYNSSDLRGRIDGLSVLRPEDDIASVRWGGRWRMPTAEELQELVDRCDWQRTTQGDAQGYLVTSKVNGNSLFFPETGYHKGCYWSSSVKEDYSSFAHCLEFNTERVLVGGEERVLGYPVRPVFP